MEDLVEVGFVKKSFGVDGFLRYSLHDTYDLDLIQSKFIFLDMAGSMVPFFVEKLDVDRSVMKIEWVDNLEEANKYASRLIYMKADELPRLANNESLDFQNYQLFNADHQYVGKIIELKEFPGQQMMFVEVGTDEILIPFHQDLLIDMSEGKIIYDIPEGVLDL